MDSIKDFIFQNIINRSQTVQTMVDINKDLNLDSLLKLQPDLLHYLKFIWNGTKHESCEWFDDDIYYIETHLLPLQDLENYEICDIRKLIENKYISIQDFNIIDLVKENKHHTLKALLPYFVNVDKQYEDGRTTLHFACEENNKDCAKLLIDAGCDIDKQAENGRTALHFACWNDSKESVKLLIDAGCDFKKR